MNSIFNQLKKEIEYALNSKSLNLFAMSDLYDNKQDCKDETHLGYSYWEHLREI